MENSSSYIDPLRSGAGATQAVAAQPAAENVARPSALTRSQVRFRGLVVAPAPWLALALAAWLSPNPSGVGTHNQLGLPPCEFLARTGWPCPTCGATTSVSAMAHGKFVAAWQAHPFGVVFFAACAAVAIAATGEALTGRECLKRLRPGVWWAWAAVIGVIAGWGLKILIGVADGTLPIR